MEIKQLETLPAYCCKAAKLEAVSVAQETTELDKGKIDFAGIRNEVDERPGFGGISAKVLPKLARKAGIHGLSGDVAEQFYGLSFDDQDFIALLHAIKFCAVFGGIPRAPDGNRSILENVIEPMHQGRIHMVSNALGGHFFANGIFVMHHRFRVSRRHVENEDITH